MNRRAFLRAGVGVTAGTAVAGCLGEFISEGAPAQPPLVQDRPDAVYIPTHVDGMEMVGMDAVGPYMLSLSYTFAHRFWLVTGRDIRMVEVEGADSVHLMGTLWERETGVFPPVGSVSMTIRKDGEIVDDRNGWPMLSQTMGFHFGDNVPLDGDGTYEVELRVDPLQARQTGAFEGLFDDPISTTISFDYSERVRNEIMFQLLDDRQGERDAIPPMDMDMPNMDMPMPVSQLPRENQLPGRLVGEGESGDGRFLVTVLDEPPTGVDGDGQYLAVSARTPYNRYPLPFMSLSGTLDRGGETVFDGSLVATVDPDLDYHYGAAIESLESGDELAISVGAPPQVGRHEGYETAFLDMDDVEIPVE